MSKRKPNPQRHGIEVRRAKDGTESYRGHAWDKTIGRNRHTAWTGSLAHARGKRVDLQSAIRTGVLADPTRLTLRDAAAEQFAGMKAGTRRRRGGEIYKPSAIRSYESGYRLYLDRPLGTVRVTDLRRRDVQDVVDRLTATLDASTVRNAVMPLRAMYRHLIARDVVAANPLVGLELPAVRGKRVKVAEPSHAAALIEAAPESDQALWATLVYAGLRMGEAQALDVRDIDLDKAVIHVEWSWDKKEGKVRPKSKAGIRAVPIPDVLRGPLAAHLLELNWSEGLVFGRTAENAFRPHTITDHANRVWKQAGLERITPREARHTYASLMIAAGVNAKALSTFMGHASITITLDLYGHLFPGSENEAADLLGVYLDRVTSPTPSL